MENNKKIILFGGTFDPIHNGHLIIARSVAEQLGIKKLTFVPNGKPPHKSNNVNPITKYEMVKAALERKHDWLFDISSHEITKVEKSYTIDTVRYFKKVFGDTVGKPYWLIGPDNLKNLHEWHKIDELVEECIFIYATPSDNDIDLLTSKISPIWNEFGYYEKYDCYKNMELLPVKIPQIDIRATEIRERVKNKLPITYLVPETVEDFIYENKLYQD